MSQLPDMPFSYSTWAIYYSIYFEMQPKLILVDEKKRVSYLETIIANFILDPSSTLPLNSVYAVEWKKFYNLSF